MPWSKTDPLKERVKFALEWEKRWDANEGRVNVSELSREFGISRRLRAVAAAQGVHLGRARVHLRGAGDRGRPARRRTLVRSLGLSRAGASRRPPSRPRARRAQALAQVAFACSACPSPGQRDCESAAA